MIEHIQWETVSEPGAAITVRTAPIPERHAKAIAAALEKPQRQPHLHWWVIVLRFVIFYGLLAAFTWVMSR